MTFAVLFYILFIEKAIAGRTKVGRDRKSFEKIAGFKHCLFRDVCRGDSPDSRRRLKGALGGDDRRDCIYGGGVLRYAHAVDGLRRAAGLEAAGICRDERASAYGDGARLADGKIRKERKKHADGLF